MADDSDLIREGDVVVFDEHGDRKSLVAIKLKGRAKVGKSLICTGDLIGARWGSTYTLSAGSTSLVAVTEHEPVTAAGDDGAAPTTETQKDNRDLVDRNTSQALTAADIEQMKASGKGGDEIIAALCKHSTTFEAKTEFAQDKYKRRKAKKYLTRLTLKRPTGWTVCQVMFDKSPAAVWNLRPDSLALLLGLANVGAGSRCLVLENCQGVVSGAVAERLGGVGALCCLGTGGKTAPLSALGQLNLTPQHKGVVSAAQLVDLFAAAQRRAARLAAGGGEQQQQQRANGEAVPQIEAAPQAAAPAAASCAAEAAAALASSSTPIVASRGLPVVAAAAAAAVAEVAAEAPPAAVAGGSATAENLDELYDKDAAAAAAAAAEAGDKRKAAGGDEQQQQQARKRPRKQQQQGGGSSNEADAEAQEDADQQQQHSGRVQHVSQPEAVDALLAGGFNSCIIAAPKLQPGAILQQLLPLLAPSSAFCVFSPWVQPLAEAMAALTASKAAVMLQLQESWLRPYQVLPARTHPHMALTTGGTGGYILSGITATGGGGGGPGGGGQEQRGGGQGGRGGGGRGGRGGGRRRRR